MQQNCFLGSIGPQASVSNRDVAGVSMASDFVSFSTTSRLVPNILFFAVDTVRAEIVSYAIMISMRFSFNT